jgi:hypothetical protein
MQEYRTYGGLDDRILSDGDVGFVGFNNRLRPDQLQGGMLADAQNMRFDRNGEAQVRKGIEVIEAPFAAGGDVLRLPTAAQLGSNPVIGDGVTAMLPTTIESATLTNSDSRANIVISNPAVEAGHTFVATNAVTVEGLGFSTKDPNGLHTLLSVTDNGDGTKTLKYLLAGANETYTTPIVLPEQLEFQLNTNTTQAVIGFNMILDAGAVTEVYASTDFSDPNESASQYILIASNLKVVAKNLATNATVDIAYPTGETVPPAASMLQAFNKVFIFRKGQVALEWDGSFSTITSGSFEVGKTYTITSLGGNSQAEWNTAAGTSGVTYAVGSTFTAATVGASGTGTATSAFSKVASGTYTQPTSLTSSVKDFSITNSVGSLHTSQSFAVGNDIIISDDGPTASCGLIVPSEFAVQKVFSAGNTVNVTGVAVSGTTITITAASHGLSLNQPITFADLDAGLNGNNAVSKVNSSTEFEVEVATTFTASDVTGTVAPAAGINFIVSPESIKDAKTPAEIRASDPTFIKRVSVGLGFSHMPAPEFAVYHQRRLVMPFQFSVNESENSYTSRGIIDEVIASDILDSDTYDQIYAQYRFNAGEADFTVGLHSFSEDNLMVFNRNSIHLISNTTSLQAASTKLLTDEVGCVARNSIQQVGNQVIFLSDNGVYSTQFFDEYNLRGTETPLSEPINETIKRINRDQRTQAVAVYFDNRYFIAVPVDKFRDSRTTNQVPGEFITKADALLAGIPRESIEDSLALRNNAILIYNFLNKQWESIDSVNSEDWDIENLIVAGEGSKRGVYAINQLGGIHKIDSRLQGVDLINVSIGGSNDTKDVKGSITTRQYTFGDMTRKNWKEFQMHVESSADNTSNFDLSAETENPDASIDLGTLSSLNGGDLLAAEDVSVRGRIGNRRGHGIQFTVNNTQGRPRIRSIQTQGATSFRSTQKAI